MGTNLTTIKMTRTLASDREGSKIMTAIKEASSLVTTTLTDSSKEETLEDSLQAKTMALLLPTAEDSSREEPLVDSCQEIILEDSRLESSMARLALVSVGSSRRGSSGESRRMRSMAPQGLALAVNSRDREVLLLDSKLVRSMGPHHLTLEGSSKEATLVDNSREVTLAASRRVKTMDPLDLTSGDSSRGATSEETI